MTTRHTLTHADELYLGDVYHSGYTPDGRRGFALSHMYVHEYGVIPAKDDDLIIDAATGAECPDTETVTYTTATDGTSPLDNGDGRYDVVSIQATDGATYSVYDLEVPRNIISKVTHGSAVVAMTILYSGFDDYFEPMSELHTATALGTSKTITGKKAFRYLASAALTAAADAEANTVNVGVGDSIGLPVRVTNKNQVIARVDGAADAATTTIAVDTDPATTATGDVRGTVAFSSAANGTADQSVWIAVPYHDTKENTFGITQA